MAYRHLKVQKKVGGKIRRYKNLAQFFAECGVRSTSSRRTCTLTNIRKLKDQSGLATIKTESMFGDKAPATWLIHFASHDLMKQKLKGRVEPARAGMLDGAKRKLKSRKR